MTSRLSLFNASLIELGSRPIADTGEDNEAAEAISLVFDQVVEECLSAGSWNFATETIKADADTGVTPEFGFSKVFAKPSDWIRTVGVSLDEYFTYPLTQYYDDDNFWSADSTPIYVRYVSDDTGLGLDLTRWPAAFTRYVELELADRVCLRITQNASTKEMVSKMRDAARKRALNVDAMNEAQPKFPPPSSWTRARWGSSSGGDRGSRSRLTG